MTPASPRESQQHSAAQIPALADASRGNLEYDIALQPYPRLLRLAALSALETGVANFSMTHPNRRRGITSPWGAGGYMLANRAGKWVCIDDTSADRRRGNDSESPWIAVEAMASSFIVFRVRVSCECRER